jgi:hypothetical protein
MPLVLARASIQFIHGIESSASRRRKRTCRRRIELTFNYEIDVRRRYGGTASPEAVARATG